MTFPVCTFKNITFGGLGGHFVVKNITFGGLTPKTSGSFAGSVRVGFRGGGGGYPRSNDNFVIFGPKSVLFGVIFMTFRGLPPTF